MLLGSECNVNVEPELAGISAAEVMYIYPKQKTFSCTENIVRKPFYNSFYTKSGINDNYEIQPNFWQGGFIVVGNLRYRTALSLKA